MTSAKTTSKEGTQTTKIETAGELRAFLCNMLVGIKNGDLQLDKASQITKMSEQITKSLYCEMKRQSIQIAAGHKAEDFGKMPVR